MIMPKRGGIPGMIDYRHTGDLAVLECECVVIPGRGRPVRIWFRVLWVGEADNAGRAESFEFSVLPRADAKAAEGPLSQLGLSDFGSPAGPILAVPVGHRFFVVGDLAGLRIEIEGAAGAIGDVSQVTEQRAFDAFLDLGADRFALANAVEKIAEMLEVASPAFETAGEFARSDRKICRCCRR